MKKIIVFAFSLMLSTGAVVYAQTGTSNPQTGTSGSQSGTSVYGQDSLNNQGSSSSNYGQDKDKKEVKFADLPQSVKEALSGSKYAGGTPAETAYEVMDTEKGTTYYKVSLNNTSGETKMVKVDADGKVKDMKDKDKHDDKHMDNMK